MAPALNGAFLALSMIPLAIEFFRKPYKAKTTVRIGVGLAQESDLGNGTNGGNIPNIALFDGNGNQIETNHGKKTIKSGDFKDIVIKHHEHAYDAPAEYISITSGGTDQICITYLAITMGSGDKNQFYGDVGTLMGPDFVSTIEWCTATCALKPGVNLHRRGLNDVRDAQHQSWSVPAKSYNKVIHGT